MTHTLVFSREEAPARAYRLSAHHPQFLRGIELPKRFDMVQSLQLCRAAGYVRIDQLSRSREEAVGRRGHPYQQFSLERLNLDWYVRRRLP